MNKVYGPFYTAEQYSDVMNEHEKWELVLTRVMMFHCLIGNEPASRCFLQWNHRPLPQKSSDPQGEWGVFSSPMSSLAGRKDADSVGLMPSIFSWMLLLVSMQSKRSETTTPASLLMDGKTLIATKKLLELSGSSPGFIYPWGKVSSWIPKQVGPLLKYIHLEELWVLLKDS